MEKISIKGLLNIQREQRDFIADYIDTINSFNFHIETYGFEKGDKQKERNDLAIKNTDLWIESYIDMFPDLQEFRDLVRSEMDRLKIERHPNYAYGKTVNHYYYSNKRKIEKLREI